MIFPQELSLVLGNTRFSCLLLSSSFFFFFFFFFFLSFFFFFFFFLSSPFTVAPVYCVDHFLFCCCCCCCCYCCYFVQVFIFGLGHFRYISYVLQLYFPGASGVEGWGVGGHNTLLPSSLTNYSINPAFRLAAILLSVVSHTSYMTVVCTVSRTFDCTLDCIWWRRRWWWWWWWWW